MNILRNQVGVSIQPILASLAFVLLFCGTSAMAQGKRGPLNADAQDDLIRQRVGVTDYQTQPINIVTNAAGQASVAIDMMGRHVVLELTPFSLRARNFQLLAAGETGKLTPVAAPSVCTYRGRIAGDQSGGSGIAASIIDGRLTAEIIDGPNGWWIQPLDQLVPGSDRNVHVLFRQQDLAPRDFKCGTDTSKFMPVEAGGIAGSGGGCLSKAQIAFDADYEYYQLFQGQSDQLAATTSDIETVLNAVDFIYRRDVAITYEITTVIVQTVEPDPYSSMDAGGLLSQFQSYWQANHTDIVRDVAHLMTGKEIDGNVIGVAWLPGVCTSEDGYALSQSKFTDTNFAWRVRLTAHELGHNWNAPHCDQGAAPCLSTCSIMCSSVSGCVQSVDEFESCSRDIIVAYRDSLSCLDPSSDVTWSANAVAPVEAAADDRVGTSVALSGDVAIIGANTDDEHGVDSGAAYIFRRDPQSDTWTQEAKISPDEGNAGDRFGISVSISASGGAAGEVAVIGAYLDDDMGRDAGAAYIFRHVGSSWVQETKLHADDAKGSDLFGRSVAIARASGSDVVIVGSFLDDDSGIATGSAYVFHNSGSGWVQETKLHASDPHDQDQFGFSAGLAIDPANNEHFAIIGAYKTDDNAVDSGAAYIFHKSGSGWSQVTKLHASDPGVNDQFGIATSISISSAGPVAIVGSFMADGSATDSGAAYVFRASGSTWNQEAKLIAGDPGAGEFFGNAVSVSGDLAIIGAYFDNGSAAHTGAAYIFQKSSTGWGQQVKLADVNGMAGDQLGFSVAINGDAALIGAWAADNNAGVDAGAIYFVSQTPLADCNNNGIADSCDIANGTSQDANANGIPDECEGPPNPCPADIAPAGGNGIVNVDDLLAVINGWGQCPAPPASCIADIAPQPGGNGVVNVDDLLAVINGWGLCP